ncbi:hypothetical protein [Paenibacillus sp. FSL M7-0420]|uniref:hypothetical protein n=1 Tax=Paenibacillus sp. FSL M7-0420 TaxID=2921609 RepID=UPI0030F8E162
MGTSAYFLDQANNHTKLTKLIEDIKNICIEKEYYMSPVSYDPQSEHEGKHASLEVALVKRSDEEETPPNDVLIDLYEESHKYQYHCFSWYDEQITLFNVAVIDEVYNNEQIILGLSSEILKHYPDLKLWIEEDWFYTLGDIEKISRGPYDNEWCYKNPIDL